MSRARGFTLVELLVALAIFAILSAFAYRSLNVMLEGREALQRESRKWRDAAFLVGRVERDLAALLNRPATGASGTALAPISSALETPLAREGLAITRAGAPLQENALAAPQRVAWRLREGRVERLTWGSVDAGPRDVPAVMAVAEASALSFRFMDARGEWRAQWGLPGSNEGPPAAVEMTLQLPSGERIVRLVDLPRVGT